MEEETNKQTSVFLLKSWNLQILCGYLHSVWCSLPVETWAEPNYGSFCLDVFSQPWASVPEMLLKFGLKKENFKSEQLKKICYVVHMLTRDRPDAQSTICLVGLYVFDNYRKREIRLKRLQFR